MDGLQDKAKQVDEGTAHQAQAEDGKDVSADGAGMQLGDDVVAIDSSRSSDGRLCIHRVRHVRELGGAPGARTFAFAFSGLKGETGEQGAPGQDGKDGAPDATSDLTAYVTKEYVAQQIAALDDLSGG